MQRYKAPVLVVVKEFAKRVLKPLAVGRAIYPFVQKVYRAYAIPAKRRRLHKYGYEVLDRLHKLLSENDVPYYCDAGTLLGFVRDGGFIPHDDDIDIGIMPETVPLQKVLKIFMDAGYGFIHAFDYNGRLLEFSVMDVRNISIDVFLHTRCEDDARYLHEIFLRWYPDRTYPNDRANIGLKFRLRGPDGLKTMLVHGVETSVPTNAEEMLDSEYGPWRKPDPNFKSESLKNEEVPGFVFRIDKEAALAHA